MNLKAIIAKIARGEDLTAEEKSALTEASFQEAMDAAAAAARRDAVAARTVAEQRATAAEAEATRIREEATTAANAKLPELERLKAEVERLKGQIGERERTIETMKAETVKLTRVQKVAALIAKHKITFVEKVDGSAMTEILNARLAGLSVEDLDDAEKAGKIVKDFVAANEAVILDTSGSGSGGDPASRAKFKGQTVKNPWKAETRNLTLQGRIAKDDPELAKRLKAEAGIPAP